MLKVRERPLELSKQGLRKECVVSSVLLTGHQRALSSNDTSSLGHVPASLGVLAFSDQAGAASTQPLPPRES